MRFCLVGLIAISVVVIVTGCAGGNAVSTTSLTPTPTPVPAPSPNPSPSPIPSPSPTPAPSPTPSPTPDIAAPSALTRNYDNMRSGVNSQETQLTPATMSPATFGKLFTLSVDEHVYGQPLYVPNLNIAGKGIHNVVFVATENDTVYAFDADQKLGAPLWQTSLVNSAGGETAIPCAGANAADNLDGCSLSAVVGVTATPVISMANNAIYVEARSVQGGAYLHKLHALDLTTGAEKFGGPVTIQASVPGTASDADSNGNVNFNPLRQNCRPALLLVNGGVYMAFASLSDVVPYHGWILGYNANSLQQTVVFNTTPNGNEGGIWQNNGLASDAGGNIFGVVGNGTPPPSSNNYGQSYIKLTPQNGQLGLVDYFTGFNAATLNLTDLDVGSSGFLLLPDQTGTPHTHLLIGAGKEGRIYVVDRDNMGKKNSADDSQIVQSIPNAVGAATVAERNFYPPIFWNGNIYFSGVNDVIRGFTLQNGQLSTTAMMQSGTAFSFPGAGLVISANGNSGAILWALEWHSDTHLGTLHAYDPGNLSHELWNSDQSGSRDSLGSTTRLNVPLVINGKAYVSGSFTVTVFGLLP